VFDLNSVKAIDSPPTNLAEMTESVPNASSLEIG